MIPETREQLESRPSYNDYVQMLESYLRNEVSYDSISNIQIANAVEKRLAFKVKDMGLKKGLNIPEHTCATISHEAVTRYLHNWKDKVQGEDDRGHRLGKWSFQK